MIKPKLIVTARHQVAALEKNKESRSTIGEVFAEISGMSRTGGDNYFCVCFEIESGSVEKIKDQVTQAGYIAEGPYESLVREPLKLAGDSGPVLRKVTYG